MQLSLPGGATNTNASTPMSQAVQGTPEAGAARFTSSPASFLSAETSSTDELPSKVQFQDGVVAPDGPDGMKGRKAKGRLDRLKFFSSGGRSCKSPENSQPSVQLITSRIPNISTSSTNGKYSTTDSQAQVYLESPTRAEPRLMPGAFPNRRTVFFFDWDDTLCPTSWIRSILKSHMADLQEWCDSPAEDEAEWVTAIPGWFSQPLPDEPTVHEWIADLQRAVIDVINRAQAYGVVCIVTNALPGWVEKTMRKWLPQLKEYIVGHGVRPAIKVIYGQQVYEKPRGKAADLPWVDDLGPTGWWKKAAMTLALDSVDELYRLEDRPASWWDSAESQRIQSVISVGDDEAEMFAGEFAVRGHEERRAALKVERAEVGPRTLYSGNLWKFTQRADAPEPHFHSWRRRSCFLVQDGGTLSLQYISEKKNGAKETLLNLRSVEADMSAELTEIAAITMESLSNADWLELSNDLRTYELAMCPNANLAHLGFSYVTEVPETLHPFRISWNDPVEGWTHVVLAAESAQERTKWMSLGRKAKEPSPLDTGAPNPRPGICNDFTSAGASLGGDSCRPWLKLVKCKERPHIRVLTEQLKEILDVLPHMVMETRHFRVSMEREQGYTPEDARREKHPSMFETGGTYQARNRSELAALVGVDTAIDRNCVECKLRVQTV